MTTRVLSEYQKSTPANPRQETLPMKALIAIVMFIFGVFVGLLVTPFLQEFSATMYEEEEYSAPRMKTLLRGFGITLPPEAADLNVFQKQDGSTRQVWVKFECSPETKDEFIESLNRSHAGHFNRELKSPRTYEGANISWWTFQSSYLHYEFNNICVAYDELLQNLYLYAIADVSSHSSGGR